MANLATKAPNFTSETGSIAGKRSGEIRRLARQREKEFRAKMEELDRLTRKPTDDETRKNTTLKQIDALDELINAALDREDSDEFVRLAAAKDRLWKLVSPTVAPIKAGRRQQPRPEIAPIP